MVTIVGDSHTRKSNYGSITDSDCQPYWLVYCKYRSRVDH